MGALHDMASNSDFQTEAKHPKALISNISSFIFPCVFSYVPPLFFLFFLLFRFIPMSERFDGSTYLLIWEFLCTFYGNIARYGLDTRRLDCCLQRMRLISPGNRRPMTIPEMEKETWAFPRAFYAWK
jgi:hypothetical protein